MGQNSSKINWNHIANGNSTIALIVEYIIDQFLLARCQKKCYEQVYDILKKSLYQINCLLGNGGPSKTRLFQSFGVLWIHWCEPNCRVKSSDIYLQRVAQYNKVNNIFQNPLDFKNLLDTRVKLSSLFWHVFAKKNLIERLVKDQPRERKNSFKMHKITLVIVLLCLNSLNLGECLKFRPGLIEDALKEHFWHRFPIAKPLTARYVICQLICRICQLIKQRG